MADLRVLLVDDESDFVEALASRLEIRGMAVSTAADGPEAIAQVTAHKFDAIILDLAMPGMDGIETLRALKDIAPDLQVILLTGRGTVQKGIQAMKLGAMDFLEKPVPIDALVERIGTAKTTGDDAARERTQQIIYDIVNTKGW